MKKSIKFLVMSALLLSAVSFSSCKKDDPTPKEMSIVGNWNASKIEVTADGKTSQQLPDYLFYCHFKADGTFAMVAFDEEEFTGTYTYRNNVLSLKVETTSDVAVVKLTETELVLDWGNLNGNFPFDKIVIYYTKAK